MHLTYSSQGDIRLMLVNMYWWARSSKARMRKKTYLAPSRTSPASPLSLASHMCHCTISNLCKYLVTKPKNSLVEKWYFATIICDYKIVIPNICNYKSNTYINVNSTKLLITHDDMYSK